MFGESGGANREQLMARGSAGYEIDQNGNNAAHEGPLIATDDQEDGHTNFNGFCLSVGAL
jgi:hypothetical protein